MTVVLDSGLLPNSKKQAADSLESGFLAKSLAQEPSPESDTACAPCHGQRANASNTASARRFTFRKFTALLAARRTRGGSRTSVANLTLVVLGRRRRPVWRRHAGNGHRDGRRHSRRLRILLRSVGHDIPSFLVRNRLLLPGADRSDRIDRRKLRCFSRDPSSLLAFGAGIRFTSQEKGRDEVCDARRPDAVYFARGTLES